MLQIKIWNVNHGSAAHIQTPNGRNIVVDLGDDGENFSPLRYLYDSGIRKVDTIVITHPHRDHMDDIGNFDLVVPDVLWTPRSLTEEDIRKGNRPVDSDVVNEYLAIRKRYSTQPVPSQMNLEVPENFGGVKFQVFTPPSSGANLNDYSLVVVLSYAGLKMVIPGDNEAPSWRALLQLPSFRSAIARTDVLLAPHHGRDAGFCAELFADDAMGKPRLIVVSDGRFCDTSATDRYGKQATGWSYFNALGEKITECKCVTTRRNGHITIKFGLQDPNWPQNGNYLNVTTSKPDSLSSLAAMYGMLGR